MLPELNCTLRSAVIGAERRNWRSLMAPWVGHGNLKLHWSEIKLRMRTEDVYSLLRSCFEYGFRSGRSPTRGDSLGESRCIFLKRFWLQSGALRDSPGSPRRTRVDRGGRKPSYSRTVVLAAVWGTPWQPGIAKKLRHYSYQTCKSTNHLICSFVISVLHTLARREVTMSEVAHWKLKKCEIASCAMQCIVKRNRDKVNSLNRCKQRQNEITKYTSVTWCTKRCDTRKIY